MGQPIPTKQRKPRKTYVCVLSQKFKSSVLLIFISRVFLFLQLYILKAMKRPVSPLAILSPAHINLLRKSY